MKTAFITLWIILFSLTIATGQAESVVGLRPDTRHIKLYRATVKTMTGEKIRGIFYAMTDSTLVFFADKKDAIEQFRAGYTPDLITVNAVDIKRITVHRKGQFLKGSLVGLGVGSLLMIPLFVSTPTNVLDVIAIISVFGLSPLSLAIGLVFGLVPVEDERVKGRLARFQRFYNKLDQYTIVSQQQRLSIRTRTTR